jgi:sporulation protein YqfC
MGKWMERLADRADLQGEVMPGQPLVEIYGEERILIEHHRGVTEYGREKIQVKMRYGSLCICGFGLELAKMNADQLIISGRIDSVSIIRRR